MLIEEITHVSIIEKRLVEAHQLDQWKNLKLDEAYQHDVEIKVCPLFVQTFKEKVHGNPAVDKKYKEFKSIKTQNPLQSYGAKDYPMIAQGPIGKLIPGMRHAHLTSDISVFYTIEGRDPTIIKLYGVFSHQDVGTGQPANPKRQKSAGQQMVNQQFD